MCHWLTFSNRRIRVEHRLTAQAKERHRYHVLRPPIADLKIAVQTKLSSQSKIAIQTLQ
ncbi:MAG: hypothetical protein AAF268_05325 [Cyanobacteria bacterium P01_A01_bin.3]